MHDDIVFDVTCNCMMKGLPHPPWRLDGAMLGTLFRPRDAINEAVKTVADEWARHVAASPSFHPLPITATFTAKAVARLAQKEG